VTEAGIPIDQPQKVVLNGDLSIPNKSKAMIIFAHGSGSGRNSPRNHHVAKALNDNGFATLLVDLLAPDEQESDLKSQKLMGRYHGIVLNKFNVHLLSSRLATITKWAMKNIPEANDLPIGYFGSSTGTAAAIEASISPHMLDKVYAIVSRGGRSDLATADSLKSVKAPTLLIVGAKDSKEVLDLNKKAYKNMRNARPRDLVIIPNAGHLFEEEGTIEQVADITAKWFSKCRRLL
jgi:putative phosphoribosyl transferase